MRQPKGAQSKSALAEELRSALTLALPELVDDGADEFGEEYNLLAAKSFTDNIVVGIPLGSNVSEESDLGDAFMSVSRFQLKMILKGYAIRGAIDVGPIYIDADMAWGSGLIASYEAEQLAREPRVVLTARTMSLMHAHIAAYGDVKLSPHYHEILVDWDGQPFVNYLDSTDYEDGEGHDAKLVSQHRDIALAGLEVFHGKPAIWSKYLWMARYHNRFCSEFKHLKKLKIKESALRFGFQRLSGCE